MSHIKKPWSPEEIEILKNLYQTMVDKALQVHLPGRSHYAIGRMRHRMKFNRAPGNQYAFWTQGEKDILRKEWSNTRVKDLLQYLPGRSRQEIRRMACKLGLKKPKSFYEPKMPDIQETEKAYFAGLFDGEGCIHLAARPPRGGKRASPMLWS